MTLFRIQNCQIWFNFYWVAEKFLKFPTVEFLQKVAIVNFRIFHTVLLLPFPNLPLLMKGGNTVLKRWYTAKNDKFNFSFLLSFILTEEIVLKSFFWSCRHISRFAFYLRYNFFQKKKTKKNSDKWKNANI